MKKLLLPLLALLFLISCEKENTTDLQPDQEFHENDAVTFRGRAPKIDVCHSGHVITISENAWPAHAGDGDVRLDDQDGDGFVPDNACDFGQQGDCDDNDATLNPQTVWYLDADQDGYAASSVTQCTIPGQEYTMTESLGNDCDDSDAAVNPGVTEVCGNNIDDDCDGETDEDCGCPEIEGLLLVTLPDGSCLYVAPEDQRTGLPQSNGVQWGGFGTDINNPIDLVNITSTAAALQDFAGAANTEAIVAQLGVGDYAAKVCDDLNAYGYDDWYLPALGELKAVYDEYGGTGQNNFDGNFYLSSTEYSADFAWFQDFINDLQGEGGKGFAIPTSCRCVRR